MTRMLAHLHGRLLTAVCALGSAAAVLTGLSALSTTASAQTLPPGQCYARTYTPAHLKANPRQKTQSILLRKLTRAQSGAIPADKSALLIAFRLRGGNEWLQKYAECRPGGDTLACDLEGDAGSFRLRTTPGGKLQIRLTRSMGFETDRFVEIGGDISDDNIFALQAAPAATCRALRAP